MNIVLVGYRGCGKTTIGRRLADSLWQKYIDLDDRIVASAGKTIREIFQQDGQEHFRDLETAALEEVLKEDGRVIGLGGGTVVREQNRRMLKESGCRTIYLRCEPEVLLQRIQADPQTAQMRPNLTELGGGIEEIRLKLAEREPLYRQVADAELDVSNLTEQEAVAHLARMI